MLKKIMEKNWILSKIAFISFHGRMLKTKNLKMGTSSKAQFALTVTTVSVHIAKENVLVGILFVHSKIRIQPNQPQTTQTNQKPTKPPKNQSNDPKSYSNQPKTPIDFENHLTLSGPAFSVVQAWAWGAQRPRCQKSRLTSTDWNKTSHELLWP